MSLPGPKINLHTRTMQPSAPPTVKAPAVGSQTKLQARAAGLTAKAAVAERPLAEQASCTSTPTQAALGAAFSTSLAQEQESPCPVEVVGTVPSWLKGSYIRNGPGHYAPEMRHMFDGYGMLSRFVFENGHVSAMQRYTLSKAFKAYRDTGRMAFSEFGTVVPLLKNLWNTVKGVTGLGQGFTDNATVNTLPLPGGEVLAMTETVIGSYQVDATRLRTRRRAQFGGSIPGDLTTAHPAVYPDGSVYNIAVDVAKGRTLFRLDMQTLDRIKIADIPTPNKLAISWVHDLPFTENYVIIMDTPLKFDLAGLITGKAAISGGFAWKPEEGMQIHIINRHSGETRTFTSPTLFFSFHYMNAFETADGKAVCIDCPAFEDGTVVNALLLDQLRSAKGDIGASPLKRLTLPLDGSSTEASLSPIQKDATLFNELGRVNPLYKGKDYQFAYHLTSKRPTPLGNALGKCNVRTGHTDIWHEPGTIPQEPCFIPRPGAQAEDDGVVLSAVTGADGHTFILVLDGQSWQEVARARLPYGMAYQFHGQFLPS